MDSYVFEDALTGSTVTCSYPGLDARLRGEAENGNASKQCESLFFPGCSLLNYGLPLVQSVYDLLREAGQVKGISLLCCGMILRYEPDGKTVRTTYERQFCDHVAASGVKRIVAACPNCVSTLRAMLLADELTAGVEVVALPQVLVGLGYRIDAGAARRMLRAQARAGSSPLPTEAGGSLSSSPAEFEAELPSLFSVHDSCPDRATGEFADGLRALMPADLIVDPEHNRAHSQCCGSLVRATGNFAAADAQAEKRGEEARAAGASAIVTACVSCTFQLTMAQHAVPVFHYLELLYDWRIDWAHVDAYMKLRFLFDDPQKQGTDSNPRSFVGLEAEGEG